MRAAPDLAMPTQSFPRISIPKSSTAMGGIRRSSASSLSVSAETLTGNARTIVAAARAAAVRLPLRAMSRVANRGMVGTGRPARPTRVTINGIAARKPRIMTTRPIASHGSEEARVPTVVTTPPTASAISPRPAIFPGA